MSQKTMVLALSVVSAALLALPAIASATPAHIDKAETFVFSSTNNTVTLEASTAEKFYCIGGISGHGTFESTTTGSISLAIKGCTIPTVFGFWNCGTASTTSVPVHLIMLANHSPGLLFTPNAETGVLLHHPCAGPVKGNGVIARISSPTCGVPNSTASLSIEQGLSTGMPKYTTYTGVDYHLMVFGASNAALEASGTIHFATPRTLGCT